MKTLDAEKLEAALTVRINWWTKNAAPMDVQAVLSALVDVRQCLREAAGIGKSINED